MSVRHVFPWSVGLTLLLLVPHPALSEEGSSASARTIDLTNHEGLERLRAGETWMFGRADGTRLLTSGEELRIALVETEGMEIVTRFTPIDRHGADLGTGRVIVLGPAERREVRLRKLFSEPQLEGVRLRVEALRGAGSARLDVSASDGAVLQAQPELSEGSRRRAVRVKSSEMLIAEGEASGAIDAETAMLYRVYVLFSDTRLPARYRGVDIPIDDSLFLDQVRDRFATLSPAIQELIQPFLTPPAYEGSWANVKGSGPTVLQTPPPCRIFSDDWSFVDSPNGVARIWYRDDSPDALRASALAASVSGIIWPALSGLMKPHLPLSDQAEDCNGGNPNLDIYLVDVSGPSFTIPYGGCGAGPAFILLKRTAPDPLLAHEIFHAFQRKFPVRACLSSANYHWWAEGSGKWAEEFVYHGAQLEHKFAQPFLTIPEQPLDLDEENHRYGSYLFPFFVHGRTGSPEFVRVAWENCVGQPALEAVNDAIPGGFDALWSEFALYNWNADPVDDYRKWDSLTMGVSKLITPVEVKLEGRPDAADDFAVNLPRVSAMYKHYKFTDDEVRTVAFWNGATKQLSLQDEFKVTSPSDTQKTKGGRVRALIKIRGQAWKIDDWTNRDVVSFCRDTVAERIDELVLIISNSEFTDRNRKLQHPGLAPVVWVSNIGCWRWKGDAAFEFTTDGLTQKITANATFTHRGGAAPPFIFYDVQGTQTWKVTGRCSGEGILPLVPAGAPSGGSFLFTYNYTPRAGRHHRAYLVLGINDAAPQSIQCVGNPMPSPYVLPPWVFTDRIEAPFLQVNRVGWIIRDGYVDPSGPVYTWQFKAERQAQP